MATLTPKNPVLKKGPPMEVLSILAANSQTWKAGQLGYAASGVFTLCPASGATAVKYVALQDQDTSTSATTVNVGVITNEHQFEVYENSTTLGTANVGESYGLVTTSNVCMLDTGDTSTKVFQIQDIASNYEPSMNASDDIKARCMVKVLQSVLDA